MPTPLDPASDLALLTKVAADAAHKSHSPYSKFRVGAAVLVTDGSIVRGANIESASYGLTICAERNTIQTALAAGHSCTAIAVACPDVSDEAVAANPGLVMPCGACRQVLVEHFDPAAKVSVDRVGVFTVGELLPYAFVLPT